jgi:hypothetical protein
MLESQTGQAVQTIHSSIFRCETLPVKLIPPSFRVQIICQA